MFEEECLIVSVLLYPHPEASVSHHLAISVTLKVLRPILEHELFKVGIIKHVGVHAPSGVKALLGMADKAQCVDAHQCNILLGRHVSRVERIIKAVHVEARSVRLSVVLDSITLTLHVGPAHSEHHLGPTAVLNGCVPTQLDEIRQRHHHCNVVSNFTDLSNLVLCVL